MGLSFHEINIAIRAENRASYAFRAIGSDLISLGHSFGLLDSSMGRAVSAFMSSIHLFTSLRAVITATTGVQVAHTAALGSTAAAHGVAGTAAIGHQATLFAYTGAATTATVATHGLRAALMTLGGPVGLILGLATAIGAVAWATNQTAEAQKKLNEAMKESPRFRSYTREGEKEYYRRRGIEE